MPQLMDFKMSRPVTQCLASIAFPLICILVGCVSEVESSSSNSTNATNFESPTDSSITTSSNDNGSNVKRDIDVKLMDYAGVQRLIEQHRGKIVVMDVWSTTCPTCIKEFPGLVKLHRKHPSSDLACISLSLDYVGAKTEPAESYRERVLEFLRSREASFDNVLATESTDDMLDKLELGAPPGVFVYGRDGKLVKRFEGSDAEEESAPPAYHAVDALVAELIK